MQVGTTEWRCDASAADRFECRFGSVDEDAGWVRRAIAKTVHARRFSESGC